MELYYRAYSVLELLVHHIAEQAGTYTRAGVEVALKDGSSPNWEGEVERSAPATIGLGGAIQSRLEHGTNWRVVCVNTQHPLFWLMAQPTVQRIAHLKGKRVAGRPLGQAPSTFLRIIFRRHGLDLLNDCAYIPPPKPVTNPRLVQMLQGGEAEAVAISSPPFELERAGFRLLAFFGVEFEATATGVAVNQDVVAADEPEVRRLVEGTRSALARLHADRALAVITIQELEPGTSAEDAGLLYDRYIRPYWTSDGRPDLKLAEASLAEIAQELRVTDVPRVSDLYQGGE